MRDRLALLGARFLSLTQEGDLTFRVDHFSRYDVSPLLASDDSAAPPAPAMNADPQPASVGIAAALRSVLQMAETVVMSARQLWPLSAGADPAAAVVEPGSAEFSALALEETAAAAAPAGAAATAKPAAPVKRPRTAPRPHQPPHRPAGGNSDALKSHFEALQRSFSSSAGLTADAHQHLLGCSVCKRKPAAVLMGEKVERCTESPSCGRLLQQHHSVIMESSLPSSIPSTEAGINTAAAACALSITASCNSLLMMSTATEASVRQRALARFSSMAADVYVGQQVASKGRALLNPQGGHLTRQVRACAELAAAAPSRHGPRASNVVLEIIAGAHCFKPSGRGLEREVANLSLCLMSHCSARTTEVSFNPVSYSAQQQGNFGADLMSMCAQDPVRLVEDAASGAHPIVVSWRPDDQFMIVSFQADDDDGPCALRFHLFRSAREALYFFALEYTSSAVDADNVCVQENVPLKLLVTTLSLPFSETPQMVSGAHFF